MLESFIHLQYCYDYLVEQISLGLLVYSHIPTALIALLFGGFILYSSRRLGSTLFFLVCVGFAAWCFVDLGSWFAFLGAGTMMFTWGLTDFLSLIFYALSYYFLYVFVTGRDLPLWQKLLSLAAILPTFYWTLIGASLTTYDAVNCEAYEYGTAADYVTYARLAFLLATIVFTIVTYVRSKDAEQRTKVALAGVGVSLFLFAFFFFSYLANLNLILNIWEYAYNMEIYGLFGMPIFLAYFGFLIVRYQAFNLKIFGAQALTVVLIVVLASEFAFASSMVNRLLVAITLLLTLIVGVILARSVRREIEQRERIEKLAQELDETNKRQESLIHFIGHEVKGYLTKSAAAFASLSEGDFGPMPEQVKPFLQGALTDSRTGAESVINILKASNLKKGTVEYKKEPFDFKQVIEGWFIKLKPLAEKKNIGLTFTVDESGAPYTLIGDGTQLGEHVVRNLIENAVNYTPKGSVSVTLRKQEGKIVFAVADTGVGLTEDDKKRLFTEGGRGKESLTINVHSTGYGLYIAKSITVAHGGTIRAESEGRGKGSTFIVELPLPA